MIGLVLVVDGGDMTRHLPGCVSENRCAVNRAGALGSRADTPRIGEWL